MGPGPSAAAGRRGDHHPPTSQPPALTRTCRRWSFPSWRRYLGGELPGGLDELLADDVVFDSPVVYTPQRGKPVTRQYLEGASRTPAGEAGGTVRFGKQVISGNTAVLEFETSVQGIRCDDAGRIVEFRVMMRPLQGVQAVHEQLGRRLAAGG